MRRIWTVTGLALLSGMLLSCTMVDDYMLGKDNTKPPSPLASFTPKVHLKSAWQTTAGAKQTATHYAKMQPVVSQNTVYTAYPDGTLQATDLETGKVKWSRNVGSMIVSGPTVGNGHIALGLSGSKLLVLNQQDGSTLWEKTLPSMMLAKPLIVSNRIFVKTIDGHLQALSLDAGRKDWGVVHGAPSLILKTSSSPVVYRDWVIAGYSDGKLESVDIQYGHELWQRSIAYGASTSDIDQLVDIDANPIVSGEQLYLATYQGYVASLSLTNGELNWKRKASVFKDMAVASGALYYTDADDVVWSLKLDGGQVNWRQNGFEARGITEPVVVSGYVVVGDKEGYVHVLSRSTGEVVGRTYVGSPVIFPPLAYSDSVIILSANGQLSRIKLGKI